MVEERLPLRFSFQVVQKQKILLVEFDIYFPSHVKCSEKK